MHSEQAPAKVNLFLHVLGRRQDGYHLLDSLSVFPKAADLIQAEPADGLELAIEGPFAPALAGDNLVMRAAQALQRASGGRNGARLILTKNLPVASGIGGGSADAAATLRLLNRLWGTGLPMGTLAEIALGLGADVPVCLVGEPSRMGGVGELLWAAPALPECGMVLINPNVPIATADVFRTRQRAYSEAAVLPPRWESAGAMAQDLAKLQNDLEPSAMRLCSEVGEALVWLRQRPGCLLARMSGSGATCFGLFATAASAQQAAGEAQLGWWSWGGALV